MPNLQRFGTGESPVASAKLNLIVDALTGAGNTPVNHGGVNDPVNYALTLRNQDTAGKAAILYAPNGTTVLLQVTAAGVLASPDGVAAAAPVLTTGSSIPASQIAATAWTAFTPTLSQGVAVTLTTASGRYVQIGKAILAQVDLVIGSAGTAGSAVFVGGLPNMRAPVGGYVVGHGRYLVAAGSRYPVELLWATATTVALQATDSVYTNVFGIAPAVTAGNTDQLALSFMYEAA